MANSAGRPYRFPTGYGRGGVSRNFGQPGGKSSLNITIHMDMSKVVDLTRIKGRFTGGGWRDTLSEAHTKMATEMRATQVEVLTERRSRRTPRSTQYLQASILDERNSLVSAAGFQVGIVRWLSRSPARMYWRRIEGGGPNPMAAQGRVVGFFYSPGRSSPAGAGRAHGRLAWRHLGNEPDSTQRHGFEVKPIDVASSGYHYMGEGARRFRQSGRILAIYKETFDARGFGQYVKLIPSGVGR